MLITKNKIMEHTIKLLNDFEIRNNISATLVIHGDGSSHIEEFWKEELIKSFTKVKELHAFLENGNLKKDEKGLCISPIKIIK